MSSDKPFPSSDLDVFKENSIILDNFVNSQENEYPDRFARKRPTITGIIKEAFNVRTDISNMNETLIGQSRWDVVPKNTSLSLGGDNGALNKQAQALFNRTEMLKVHAREALRRTYQEVGLVLVPGSFEDGGKLETIADILLEEKTGKVYSWNGSFPKVVNKGTSPSSEVEFVDKTNLSGVAKHKAESNAHPISSIENLTETLKELESKQGEGRTPVLSIEYIQKRSAIWPGYVPGDGGVYSRNTYPSAFKAIQDGLVPVCTDAEWLTDPGKRGCFTLGDGSTNFRVPDYNGKYSGSYGPVYLGGGSGDSGSILRDRIQNLKGTLTLVTGGGDVDGIFKYHATKKSPQITAALAGQIPSIELDSSLVVRSGETTRPITAEGCWGVKLFGAVINQSNIDAEYLASEITNLNAKVNTIIAQLGTKREVCLVNALGTGIENEIVEPLIPALILTGKRIVLPNPFGNKTPVIFIPEVYSEGIWCDPNWTYGGDASGKSYGVRVSYVQGLGLVLRTGTHGVASDGHTGSAFVGGIITSAPLRIRVIKNL
ncbi:MAG: hypothetical protein ACRCVV_10340 [Shewanella sp.]